MPALLLALPLLWLLLRLAGLFIAPVAAFCRRGEALLWFWLWYLLQVQKASLQVARLTLLRPQQVTPAVIAVELLEADERIATLVALLLTLTPGSLALDYRPGQRQLFLHVLDAHSAATVQAEAHDLQCRLLRWLKPASLLARSLP